MLLNRRSLMTGLGVAAAAPLLPKFASAADAASIQLAWIPNAEYGGFWIALEKGYFKEKGLDVTYKPGGPNATPGPVAVASGQANYGLVSFLPFLDAVAKGNDQVLIGVTLQQSPLGILSLAKNPIKTPKDIVGKTILGTGASVKAAVEATLALAGLPNQWKQVDVGFTPEPLVNGQGDGQVGFITDQPLQLEEKFGMTPKDYVFTSFDDLGFRSYAALIFTSRAYLAANRPAVVNFMRGWIKGWTENEKNPELGAQLATDKYGRDYSLELKHQIRENTIQNALLRPKGKPDWPLMMLDRSLISGAIADGVKATGRTMPDLDKIIDFKVVEEAHKAI